MILRGRPDGRGGRRTSLLIAPLRPLANLGGEYVFATALFLALIFIPNSVRLCAL